MRRERTVEAFPARFLMPDVREGETEHRGDRGHGRDAVEAMQGGIVRTWWRDREGTGREVIACTPEMADSH